MGTNNRPVVVDKRKTMQPIECEAHIGVTPSNLVELEFGQAITHIAMPPQYAMLLGRRLVEAAARAMSAETQAQQRTRR